jgi:3',5'-cyclic AMP phosphodiesterase CpdA
VSTRALHVSDLHAGRRETPRLAEALAALVEEVAPELVIATGDLAHRGREEQLSQARALLAGLGAPFLAVPGNHDIPYSFPARFTRPWQRFEAVFGSVEPAYRSEMLVVCGLDSVRPWRQQGGRLSPARLARVGETLREGKAGALRVVALHHHLAGSPWRASRKLPLKHRDRALAAFAAAGAELVVGGHIHQASVAEMHEFSALEGEAKQSIVLATAPGLGRPRPHRSGEAQGALVYEWDADRLGVLTYVWEHGRFARTARREFPRSRDFVALSHKVGSVAPFEEEGIDP